MHPAAIQGAGRFSALRAVARFEVGRFVEEERRRRRVDAEHRQLLWVGGAQILDGRRQPSRGGTSRMTRERHVRICEAMT